MPLAAATRLGPYEIVAPLGAGGMGEVYRARDTRLDRMVAVKVLPAHLSSDPRAKERFEREARAVASLSHPHICPLYDIGHEGGVDFLVMECLEGQTLSQRLKSGPLPPEEAVPIAAAIAAALDAAHRKGVVHRDLKPGNVMLTKSGAKLLDFGLAKAVIGPEAATASEPLTADGGVLGTLQYMAPEQLAGHTVDGRADLYALGAVLYEMLTGRKAFEGQAETALLTPPLQRVVKRCLARDPEERWQSARDLACELAWIAEPASAPAARPARLSRLPWWLAAASVVVAVVFAALYLRRAPARSEPVHFTFPAADTGLFGGGASAVSPDGARIAYVMPSPPGQDLIWLRSLESASPQALPGTEGAFNLFWSPDGRSIGFFADAKLKRIDLPAGPVRVLCEAPTGVGAAWSPSNDIVFTPSNRNPLYRVSAAGGAPLPITTLNKERQENSHRWPYFLPDGRHFLFLARAARPENTALYVASLDNPEPARLLTAQSNASYAPPGLLLFARDEKLMGQPFDAGQRRLTGEPFPIAENVRFNLPSAFAPFSVSADGSTLSYRSGGEQLTQFSWFDRSGKPLGTIGPPGPYRGFRLSPDGKRVAIVQADPRSGNRDIWMMELSRGVVSRFTSNPANDWWPVWSPDGNRILFSSDRDPVRRIFQKPSSGAGEEEPFQKAPSGAPRDWSGDGRFVAYESGGTSPDIWIQPLAEPRTPFPLLKTEFAETDARFSPDSRYLGFVSNESGRFEVYLQPFPEAQRGGKWRVSTNGGTDPQWRRDGKELFYLAPDQLMSVDLSRMEASAAPRPLFRPCSQVSANMSGNRTSYAAHPDGQRFLLNCLTEGPGASQIHVVRHWAARLKP